MKYLQSGMLLWYPLTICAARGCVSSNFTKTIHQCTSNTQGINFRIMSATMSLLSMYNKRSVHECYQVSYQKHLILPLKLSTQWLQLLSKCTNFCIFPINYNQKKPKSSDYNIIFRMINKNSQSRKADLFYRERKVHDKGQHKLHPHLQHLRQHWMRT